MSEKKVRETKKFEFKVDRTRDWFIDALNSINDINNKLVEELNEISNILFFDEWAKYLEDQYWSMREEQSNLAYLFAEIGFDAMNTFPWIQDDERLKEMKQLPLTFLENEKSERQILLDETREMFDKLNVKPEDTGETAEDIVKDLIENWDAYEEEWRKKREDFERQEEFKKQTKIKDLDNIPEIWN